MFHTQALPIFAEIACQRASSRGFRSGRRLSGLTEKRIGEQTAFLAFAEMRPMKRLSRNVERHACN
jgi:hypothetical protein